MTSSDFLRLAKAVRALEDHRRRVRDLIQLADRLAGFDVIVVAGEQEVLHQLDLAVRDGEELLGDLDEQSSAQDLSRLEGLVSQPAWSVLDDVQRQLNDKSHIAERARTDVETRLAKWSDISSRIASADRRIEAGRLNVREPARLRNGRSRLTALMRQANASLAENRFLDVWRALGELEQMPNAGAGGPMRAEEVPDLLESLVARADSGTLHLTVLRGPDGDYIEYTLILLTSAGDQYSRINVQDASTIARADRERSLRGVHLAGVHGYRALRDAAPPASAAPASPAPAEEDLSTRLRNLGKVLYRLVIPTRMRELMELSEDAPLILTTNDRELCWELMFATDYVALKRPLARTPVGRVGALRGLSPARPAGPRRVALIGSSGSGSSHLGAVPSEIAEIAARLRAAWRAEVRVDVFLTGTDVPADGENLERVLISGEYDIIHYAGHAFFDSSHPAQSGLVLDGSETCSAEKIQRLIYGSPLVFLNACETARLADPEKPRTPEGAYEGDPRDGLASAFLYGGAMACIGNSWPVPDTVAAAFAVAFYNSALEGFSLGEAMRVARQTVAAQFPQDPAWASFAFYGDPGLSLDAHDGMVFEEPAG
jgi:hypothetical protein